MYVCVFNGSSLIERRGFDNSQNNAGFFLYKIQTALNNFEYKYMHVHFLPSASPLQILGPRFSGLSFPPAHAPLLPLEHMLCNVLKSKLPI